MYFAVTRDRHGIPARALESVVQLVVQLVMHSRVPLYASLCVGFAYSQVSLCGLRVPSCVLCSRLSRTPANTLLHTRGRGGPVRLWLVDMRARACVCVRAHVLTFVRQHWR